MRMIVLVFSCLIALFVAYLEYDAREEIKKMKKK